MLDNEARLDSPIKNGEKAKGTNDSQSNSGSLDARRLLFAPFSFGKDRLIYFLPERNTDIVLVGRPEDIRIRPSKLAAQFDLLHGVYVICEKEAAKRISTLLFTWFEKNVLTGRVGDRNRGVWWLDRSAKNELFAFLHSHCERLGFHQPCSLERLEIFQFSNNEDPRWKKEAYGRCFRRIPMDRLPKLFRRHTNRCIGGCKQYDRGFIECNCVIHTEGRINAGYTVRQSLHVRDWTEAQTLLAQALQEGFWRTWGALSPGEITFNLATEIFLAEYKGRDNSGLRDGTLSGYRNCLSVFASHLEGTGDLLLSDLSSDDLGTLIRKLSNHKHLNTRLIDTLHVFFTFCLHKQWLQANPLPFSTSEYKRDVVVSRRPFSEDEFLRIAQAASETSEQAHALVLLLRHSGLWISDAVMIRQSNIYGNELRIKMIKGGKNIALPLEPEVRECLSKIKPVCQDYLFAAQEEPRLATITDFWRRKLRTIADRAGLPDANPNRFRHTFTVTLLRSGIEPSAVSEALGHTSPTVTAAQYDKEFQEAKRRHSSNFREALESAIRNPAKGSRKLQRLVEDVDRAHSAHSKGKSLEELCSELFSTVEGLSVVGRNVKTQTEEIDIFIENNSEAGHLQKEAFIILAECKNWTSKCDRPEFNLFRTKMNNRRRRCSLGFLISWNGFAETVTLEMLRDSHEELFVVPVTGSHIREAVINGNFAQVLLDCYREALGI